MSKASAKASASKATESSFSVQELTELIVKQWDAQDSLAVSIAMIQKAFPSKKEESPSDIESTGNPIIDAFNLFLTKSPGKAAKISLDPKGKVTFVSTSFIAKENVTYQKATFQGETASFDQVFALVVPKRGKYKDSALYHQEVEKVFEKLQEVYNCSDFEDVAPPEKKKKASKK